MSTLAGLPGATTALLATPPTAPTGLPVPAENASPFLALLMAALPGQEPVPQAAPEAGSATAGETPAAPAIPETEDAEQPGATEEPEVVAQTPEVPQVSQTPVPEWALQSALGLLPSLPTGPVPAGTPGLTTETTLTVQTPETATAATTSPALLADGPTETPSPLGQTTAATTATGALATPAQPPVQTAVQTTEGAQPGALVLPAGMAAVAPTAAPDAPAPAAPASSAHVTSQVFGEVTSLVSRGNGTHRITLQLNPEALGEVRVTLTVRNGEVTVSFAAGDQARHALLEGAPELVRLLELTGASESRIQVRDPSAPEPLPASTGQQREDARSPGGDRGPTDHHAGTREGRNATDGTTRGPGVDPLPHDPVSRSRATGIDVTV
ncbi:flagellar hook-length control protein FliK [Nocardioides campestrisoli]|uniref:flagellar hook-length control protein FliK n=1 Tax=Nocardioides campestrisoli TaxID=2736757 RepID=UPI00163D8C15|nr:flagellar hook-length control protein FliK [Nocardioides campestrisoli]